MHSPRPQRDRSSRPVPELPSLEPGVTLLTAETDTGPLLQTLAVDELLLSGGEALWVGTGRHCTTETLAEVAPDRRVLDRVRVARGFTAYQHTALLRRLDDAIDDDTAVLVVPDIDARYRGDGVQGADGQSMLVRALAPLARVAREHDLPVLCTRSRDDAFSKPVEAAATTTLVAEATPLGPRFVGDAFETLVYPLSGDWVQTTIAFWQEVLQARQPLHDAAPATEVSASGTN